MAQWDRDQILQHIKTFNVQPTNGKVQLKDEGGGAELYMIDYPNFQLHLHYNAEGELSAGHLKGKGANAHVRDNVYQVDADVILSLYQEKIGAGKLVMEHVS